MVNIIVCSVKDSAHKIHRKHIAETAGCDYEYIRIDNSENKYGLCAAYNEGVERATGDILAFVHEDVFIITPKWGQILETKFQQDNAVGLIGVAGTQYLLKDDPFWVAAGRPFIKGRVVHEMKEENRCILTVFSEEEIDTEAVAVDGLFFAVRKELFDAIRFDEKTFDKFHFYDLDICMQVRKTHKIVITSDILVKHFSGGAFKEEWKIQGKKFIDKYRNKLPVSCTDEKPDPENRIPFDSLPLETVLSPQAYTYIKNLGNEVYEQQQVKTTVKKQYGDIIAVTGMHRSGTSAVAGLLSKCGFSLGSEDNLLNRNVPKFDNRKGHFENINVVLINDMALKAAGGSWCNLPQQNDINSKGEILKKHITNFDYTFEGNIVKDPRLCLTLDLWKQYCSRLKYVLICFRHPLSVAQSLNKRNTFPVEAGLTLWYEYNVRLIDNIEHTPVVVVDYDNLMEHLEDDFFDILRVMQSPITRDEMKKNISGFFEKELNHNPIEEKDTESLPEDIKELYATLKSQAISVRMGR